MIVEVEADATPPRVRIETTAATVTRLQDGVSTPVRGVVEDGVLYDNEVPQETPVTYDDGLEVSELVEMPNVGDWLIHLSDPALSCRIDFSEHLEWSSPANTSVARIPGGPTVVVSMARADDEGSFTLNTYTRDDELALRALLEDGSPLFLSTHAEVGFGPCYLTVGDVTWARFWNYSGDQSRVVTLPYVETDRPLFVAGEGLTWEDLPSTWAALASTWDTLEHG